MKGYKGFNADLMCRGYQYEIGKTYSHKGEIKLCEAGLHFCESPFDVLTFYPPAAGARYCVVEASGRIEKGNDKCVTDVLKIVREISISELYKEAWALIRAHSQTSGNKAHSHTSGYEAHSHTSGNKAHSQTSGDYAHSHTSGDEAHSQTSGNGAHSQTSGDKAIACALGIRSKAMAQKGWIVLVDWRRLSDGEYIITNIHSAKVGGEILGVQIEFNKWYWFEDGILKSENAALPEAVQKPIQ